MTTDTTPPHRLPGPPPTHPWTWSRLLFQLGVGPSAAGMLAWPYLRDLSRTPSPTERSGSGS
jgi:hypothetical protein